MVLAVSKVADVKAWAMALKWAVILSLPVEDKDVFVAAVVVVVLVADVVAVGSLARVESL